MLVPSDGSSMDKGEASEHAALGDARPIARRSCRCAARVRIVHVVRDPSCPEVDTAGSIADAGDDGGTRGIAINACIRRHVASGAMLAHDPPRPQPARYARRAARGRQRRARRPAARAQPLGDEPGAGAAARDDGRSAAGARRARPRAHAARARAARAGRPAGAAMREAILRPAAALDLARLERTFTLRAATASSRIFGAALVARVAREAPGVRLRFVPKPDRDSTPLRDGASIWKPASSAPTTGPEVRTQTLFRDRFVGVVRRGPPADPRRGHARALRGGQARRRVALAASKRARSTTRCVRWGWNGGRGHRRRLLRSPRARARSDLVATVPERYTGALRDGHAQVRAAGRRGAGVHDLDALASSARRRSGASLAARLRP